MAGREQVAVDPVRDAGPELVQTKRLGVVFKQDELGLRTDGQTGAGQRARSDGLRLPPDLLHGNCNMFSPISVPRNPSKWSSSSLLLTSGVWDTLLLEASLSQLCRREEVPSPHGPQSPHLK